MILALAVPNAASAELLFPTDTKEFVIDEAGVLTQTEVETLTEDLDGLYNEWGTEIVVVIIESTAHYQIPDQLSDNSSNENSNNSTNGTSDNSTNGTSDNSTNGTSDEPMMGLQDFSEALFDEWRVGDQEWKDGILFVLSINQSEDDYKWYLQTGIFWDEHPVLDDVGETSIAKIEDGNWAEALSIITDDLVTAVDDFWYENDGYVDPPGVNAEILDDDYSVDGGIGTLVGAIVCFGLIAVVIVVVVLLSRSSGGGGGVSGGFRNTGYNQGGYGYNQGFGHNEQHVYHHHDNHQSNNQPAPSKSRKSSSGGSSRGGSSRGGSSRGGGSSGGSSRGSSGGSSRSGGSRGGGRSGGGRRR